MPMKTELRVLKSGNNMIFHHPPDHDGHSGWWWLGYNYLGPRMRVHHFVAPDNEEHKAEWLSGWQTRFHGEKP